MLRGHDTCVRGTTSPMDTVRDYGSPDSPALHYEDGRWRTKASAYGNTINFLVSGRVAAAALYCWSATMRGPHAMREPP